MIALALCLAAAPIGSPPSSAGWALQLEPARAGTVDLMAASGLAFTSSPVAPVAPSVALGARWGITDNVQLALPLLVTGSFSVDDIGGVGGLSPRFAVTTGLAGAGYSSAAGVILAPALAGTVSLVGRRMALVFTADASAQTAGGDVVDEAGGGVAGVVVRLDDRWSLGFSGRLAARHDTAGGRDSATIGVGSPGGAVPADVPTVRVRLTGAWSLELWAFAAATTVKGGPTSPVTVGANAGVTWHIGAL